MLWRYDQVTPPSVDTCHWTVGDGAPEAAALKEYVVPTSTVESTGFVDTVGTV